MGLSERSQNLPPDVPQYLERSRRVHKVKIWLKVKTLYFLKSSIRWGIQRGGKYCALKYVFRQIDGWKAQKTLRSAERAPTLSADL
jgi:hypothetical protein